MTSPPELSMPKYLQEDEGILTPEGRSLLRTLPSEKGMISTYVYLYQGFWFSIRQMKGVLSVQQNFQANHSDILIAAAPKTGTTWLCALLFTLLNRSRYSPDGNDHPLLRNNPHELVPLLELVLYSEDQDPDLSGFIAPRLFATHIPFGSLPSSVKSSECKIVYICRNPKDTFISLWHFANKLRPKEKGTISLEDTFDKFCRGSNPYGPFWDHVLAYWKASEEMPHKVLFVKFEEIKEQPSEQLRRLAGFLGCPFSKEEDDGKVVEEILRLCSIESLSALEVNQNGKLSLGVEKHAFFRQGKVGDWANYLTDEMIERIDRITKEKLHGSTLKF